MFFLASKILVFVENPLDWVLALLIVAALLFWRRRETAARRSLFGAMALLTLIGVVGIPERLTQQLENAHAPVPISADFQGVIVLGGAIDGAVTAERGQAALGGAAERLTVTLAVAREWPQLKMILTGSHAAVLPRGMTAAATAAHFFEEQGVPRSRFLLEESSRNTHEIAVYCKQLPDVDFTKPWLLLTSASNMTRALLVFRKEGWNVQPLPVDYMTGTTIDYARFSIQRGAAIWTIWLHEIIGIAVYRLTGRI